MAVSTKTRPIPVRLSFQLIQQLDLVRRTMPRSEAIRLIVEEFLSPKKEDQTSMVEVKPHKVGDSALVIEIPSGKAQVTPFLSSFISTISPGLLPLSGLNLAADRYSIIDEKKRDVNLKKSKLDKQLEAQDFSRFPMVGGVELVALTAKGKPINVLYFDQFEKRDKHLSYWDDWHLIYVLESEVKDYLKGIRGVQQFLPPAKG